MQPPLREVVNAIAVECSFTLWPLGSYGIAANDSSIPKTTWRENGFSPHNIQKDFDGFKQSESADSAGSTRGAAAAATAALLSDRTRGARHATSAAGDAADPNVTKGGE